MPDPVTPTSTTIGSGSTSNPAPVASSGTTHDGTPVGTSAPSGQVSPETPAPKPDATSQDWRTALPDELKAEKTFESFKDPAALAKSYLELRKMQGSAIRIPGDSASKEEVDAFYQKLGWEADAAKVNVQSPVLPTGMEFKPEELEGFKKVAIGLRLNGTQIQGILNYYGDFAKSIIPDYKGDAEKATTTLKTDWGLAVDRNMGVARRALLTDFPKETVERIERAGLANDVGFIKAMFERGKGLIEEGLIPEEIGQGVDEASAKQKISEMEGDAKSPLWNKEDPRHQEFVDKRAALYKVVYA